MGKKQDKRAVPPPPTTPRPRGLLTPVRLTVLIALVALGAGAFAYLISPVPLDVPGTSSPAQSASAAPAEAAAPAVPPAPETPAEPLKPHPQANLPPLPAVGFAPIRAPEVLNAAYRFAAEHPEITSYVPCFCGCERAGHRGNQDCFVSQRDANGDVVAWDAHGMECAVCIDVCQRSMQMHSAGASARDIRAAIERDYTPKYSNKTPTPLPPAQ
jgi:hypothetical protein